MARMPRGSNTIHVSLVRLQEISNPPPPLMHQAVDAWTYTSFAVRFGGLTETVEYLADRRLLFWSTRRMTGLCGAYSARTF